MTTTRFYIIMGVSGCGKTSVGKLLAEKLSAVGCKPWNFYDADAFHPPANIAKMSQGIPLNDDDRQPWLDALHDLIAACLQTDRPGVLACSALKESYRRRLLEGNPGVQLVHLKGSYDQILARMATRADHYMKPGMLQSQFAALETPQDALEIDITASVESIVDQVLAQAS